MAAPEIEQLIQILARLPGLGPRSARRAALHLLERKESVLEPLAATLARAGAAVRVCGICGNLDAQDPCAICADPGRDMGLICVVEQVADVWALERAGVFRGAYHVLGGVLSALDGKGPEDLAISGLLTRAAAPGVTEVILATSATVDGQTTAHYLVERLKPTGVAVSGLAHGVPVGGELDFLDEGTLSAALRERRGYPG